MAPPSLRPALRAARQLSDRHGALPPQAALARFIADGPLARHVRKASGVYRERHAAWSPPSSRAPGLELVPSAAGLHVCARLPGGRPGEGRRVVSAARRVGVAVESLDGYCLGAHASASDDTTAREGVVVGYGAVADDRLAEGLRRLVRVLRRETTVS